MTHAALLEVEVADHVATLFIANAARKNALPPAFWPELAARVKAIADDREVRAVVLAGRGEHFSVGIDLKALDPLFMAPPQPGIGRNTQVLEGARQWQGAVSALAELPVPSICAVQGHCLGGGLDLATACDFRLASQDARFAVAETRMAIVADLGTLQRLPRIVGLGAAREMVFTGAPIDAQAAEHIGLINRILPDAESLLVEARRVASAIAANSPLAVRGAKQVMRFGEDHTVAEGLEYVALWNSAFLHSQDLGEAFAAFLGKRPPAYSGT